MNWTSRQPIGNTKCIVETSTGCVFPAYYSGGTWWNYSRNFPVESVIRWIVYPEGEEPNDCIAPEVMLKYMYPKLKEMKEIAKGESAKVAELKKLNKNLVKEYNALLAAYRRLRNDSEEKALVSAMELEAKRKENRELNMKLGEQGESSDSGNSRRMEKILKENEHLKEELKLVRKQARKGRTLHGNLRKLLEQSCILESVGENQMEEEIVA